MVVLLVPEMPFEGHFIGADLVADFPDTCTREFLEPLGFTACERRGRVLLVSELFGEFGRESSVGWE